MKFTVITPKFDLSGVPLAQIRLANALIKKNSQVDIIVGRIDKTFKINEHLNKNVKVINLNVNKTRWMFFGLLRYLIFNKSSIIFSAEDHLNSIILIILIILFKKNKICCSSRVTPFDTYSNKIFSKKWFLKLITKSVIWRSNINSCVSEGLVKQYKKIFSKSNHICIYNIVQSDIANYKAKIKNDRISKTKTIKILAVGRLAKWKGFDVLIHSISLVVKKYSNIYLYILGDGPERSKLEQLINRKGLKNIIKLEGYVSNPYNYYSNCEIFVLSSYVEGMPNVLIESMMFGCTPVSTDCETGPREIIKNNHNGYLCSVGNIESLADTIIKAINYRINKNILYDSTYKFSEEFIMKKYFNLLNIKWID